MATPNAVQCNVSFFAPGEYSFVLVVTDASNSQASANVSVWVPLISSGPAVAAGQQCYPGFVCSLQLAVQWLPVNIIASVGRHDINATLRFGVTSGNTPVLSTGIDQAGSMLTVTAIHTASYSANISGNAWTRSAAEMGAAGRVSHHHRHFPEREVKMTFV